MKKISKEIVKEYYVAREKRNKGRAPDSGDHNLEVIEAYREWYEVALPRDLFMRLVIVDTCGSRPLLPKDKPRLLEHVSRKALCVLPEYQGPWCARYILGLRDKFTAGEPFPDLLILREKVTEEPEEGSLYLQDGNHRAIAYAMALVENNCDYRQVRAYVGSDLDCASAFGQKHRPAEHCWSRKTGLHGGLT